MNGDIRAKEIRVVAEDGEMLGLFSVPEAVSLAEGRGLDLIEIAPTAKPPTCKIMDYGKWKYENKKKAAEARKKQVIVSIKEVQLRPRTEDHDLETKLRNATKFLLNGDKVKVNLRFSGREMAHQELGRQLLMKVTKKLDDISIVEQEPKSEGRHLFVMLAPDAKKIKEWEKNKKAEKQLAEAEVSPSSDTAADGDDES